MAGDGPGSSTVPSQVALLADFHVALLELLSSAAPCPSSTINGKLSALKDRIPAKLRNKLQRISSAYSALRHLSRELLDGLLGEAASALAGSGPACAGQVRGNRAHHEGAPRDDIGAEREQWAVAPASDINEGATSVCWETEFSLGEVEPCVLNYSTIGEAAKPAGEAEPCMKNYSTTGEAASSLDEDEPCVKNNSTIEGFAEPLGEVEPCVKNNYTIEDAAKPWDEVEPYVKNYSTIGNAAKPLDEVEPQVKDCSTIGDASQPSDEVEPCVKN